MSLQGITASAKDVGYNILEKSTKIAKWCGHQISNVAGYVKEGALVIANWVKGFFKTLPHYINIIGGHIGTFAKHIRNNKVNSAGIAVLASAITLGSILIFRNLSKES